MSNALARREPEEVALLTGPRAAARLAPAHPPPGERRGRWGVPTLPPPPGAGV